MLVEGVHRITIRLLGLPYVNAFLVDGEDGLILIDTGLPHREGRVLRTVESIGKRPEALRHIVITHHHADHTGSLAALVARTGAKVFVHSLDAPIVRGDRPSPGPTRETAVSRAVLRLGRWRGLTAIAPTPVDFELDDGQELPIAGGIRVVHTPGHTAGHVSLLLPSKRLLIVGDAAGALFGRVGPPIGMFTEDMMRAKHSIRRLAELDGFDTACFGHGTVVEDHAAVRFRRLVERLAA